MVCVLREIRQRHVSLGDPGCAALFPRVQPPACPAPPLAHFAPVPRARRHGPVSLACTLLLCT
jgi:hypothetical protein